MESLRWVMLAVALLFTGCATPNYSTGRPFASESVGQIVKGKTTTTQLEQLFGQPFSKMVVSATEEKWTYMHMVSSSDVNYLTGRGKMVVRQKLLDVLIKDGVVTNFAYSEGPIQTVQH